MIKRNLEYEPEPDIDEEVVDFDDIYDEEFDSYAHGYYEVEVAETVTKIVRVYAPNAKAAKEYIEQEILSDPTFDMKKDIDSFKREVTEVFELDDPVDVDYTVPDEWM